MINDAWLAFHKDFPRDRAEAIFAARFGSPPEDFIERHGLVYFGPVHLQELEDAAEERPIRDKE